MAGPQIQPPRPTLMVLTGRVRPARRPMSSGTAGIAAVLVLGPLTWCLGILRRALALGPGCSSSLDRGGRGGLACWGGQREELGRGRRSRRSGLQLRTRGRQCLGRRRVHCTCGRSVPNLCTISGIRSFRASEVRPTPISTSCAEHIGVQAARVPVGRPHDRLGHAPGYQLFVPVFQGLQ